MSARVKRVAQFHAEVIGTEHEPCSLDALRDTLLAKLISGELRLEGVNAYRE